MYWDVVEVRQVGDLALEVRFADGLTGSVRFEESALTGVFTALKDPKFFAQVMLGDGFVTWPGELDLAPDAMYEEIKKAGVWRLK
jgi:Protein of unknown function (DUF2442)